VGRTAGITVLGAALIAVALATSVFGAGGSDRSGKLRRGDAVSARVHFAKGAAKAGRANHKTLYGSARVSLSPGEGTITLRKCPRRSHVVNGSLAALHGDQARWLTIRGFGIAGDKPNKWFIDARNGSRATGRPFNVKVVGFLICQRG
jgi:hypothetical protein